MNKEPGIHDGHRARMRRKFATHGARTLETYELLEMLLYNIIPYKDTNPVSKKLLAEFGSLDGVFHAKKDELMRVAGVGEAVAEYILRAANFINLSPDCEFESTRLCFDDHDFSANYIGSYFSDETEQPAVAMLLLDNRMRMIDIATLYHIDYESGAILPEKFLQYALENRASVAIIAHTHPYGSCFPSRGDIVTNEMVADALDKAGVTLVEHFVFAGRHYVGMMQDDKFVLNRSFEFKKFVSSKKEVAR